LNAHQFLQSFSKKRVGYPVSSVVAYTFFTFAARMYLKLLVFALLCTIALNACTNVPGADIGLHRAVEQPALPAYLEEFVREYAQYFTDSVQSTHTPGAAIVIVKDSQIVFMRGYGPRYVGGRDSIDEHTVFRIGSLSKGFAGVLTGILAEDSGLSLNDPVRKHYPPFALRDTRQTERIRLWHLLSHTTGLPYHAFTNLIEKDFSIARIVSEYFPKVPVSGNEGEYYAYQNAAFCVIEEVINQQTGQTYAQLLTEKVFAPAGMRQASCDFEAMRKGTNHTLPHYETGPGTWRADSISPHYYNAVAAGGVNASIVDMGQWLKVLLGNRPDIVRDSTLDRVFRPVVKTDKERRLFPRWLPRNAASYALGWRVLEYGTDTLIYHGGYVNGFKSEIALNRRDGIGICVLFNAHTEMSGACIPAFFERWKEAKSRFENSL